MSTTAYNVVPLGRDKFQIKDNSGNLISKVEYLSLKDAEIAAKAQAGSHNIRIHEYVSGGVRPDHSGQYTEVDETRMPFVGGHQGFNMDLQDNASKLPASSKAGNAWLWTGPSDRERSELKMPQHSRSSSSSSQASRAT